MKMFRISLFLAGIFIAACTQTVHAVVPTSTSLELESRVQIGHQQLVSIVAEIRHREEENIRFLDEIKRQLDTVPLKNEDNSPEKIKNEETVFGQKILWIIFTGLFLLASYLLANFLNHRFFHKE